MTPHDEGVFLKAARQFRAWILVRPTNKRSLQYKGGAVYQPKPISCKPKTADRPLGLVDKQVDGLVADPFRWPAAFSRERIDEARQYWTDFCKEYRLGEKYGGPSSEHGGPSSWLGFAIDTQPRSRHEGCLTLHGKYLYGDYDLFHIVFLKKTPQPSLPTQTFGPVSTLWPLGITSGQTQPSGPVSTRVPTGPRFAKEFQIEDFRDENWDRIADFINQQLGAPMIQHGSQFLYQPDKFEEVYAFGPGNETREYWSAEQVWTRYQEWNRVRP